MPSSPENKPRYRVRATDWARDGATLARVRRRVFIEEQGVPEPLEWDGKDEQASHIIAEDANGAAIGTGRLLDNGHIGRMAVLPAWRSLGVGSAILTELLAITAQRQYPRCWLNAQASAVGFYLPFGFVVDSDEFLDAGIPHYRMIHVPER